MPKTKISEFDSTPANNTDIDGINIAEGCAPSGINNAIRELMSQLKDQQTGASADNFTVGGNLVVTGTSTITSGSITGITDIAVVDGGTGASTAANARTNLSAASSGANSDITSITGLTTPLTVAQGGIGAATLTANNVLLGNGTSAPQVVAPSTAGNVLTSNGTTWTSAALPGGVTSAVAGNGVAVSAATGAVTFSSSCPTFNSVGSYCQAHMNMGGGQVVSSGENYAAGVGNLQVYGTIFAGGSFDGGPVSLSGTWKWMGGQGTANEAQGIQAIACRVS